METNNSEHRPISTYDNLNTISGDSVGLINTNTNGMGGMHSKSNTNRGNMERNPLNEISFKFDEDPKQVNNTTNGFSNGKDTNVYQKPVMSEAKSSFFGLNTSTKKSNENLSKHDKSSPQHHHHHHHRRSREYEDDVPVFHVHISVSPSRRRRNPNLHHHNQNHDDQPDHSSDHETSRLISEIPNANVPVTIINGDSSNKSHRVVGDNTESLISDVESKLRTIDSNSSSSSSSSGSSSDSNCSDNNSNRSGTNSDPVSETSTRSVPSNSNGTSHNQSSISGTTTPNRHTRYILPESIKLMDQQPSQAVYMMTTVPQNIKSNKIMGRHTPTRNSLRHSRMLVINKNYQGGEKRNPFDIENRCLIKWLLALMVTIGVSITCLCFWILLWAPNTRLRDNPYWSGLVLILTAAIGLSLIEFKRVPRQRLRESYFKFMRINAICTAILAVVLTILAFTFSAIHLGKLYSPAIKCTPASIFMPGSACICTYDTSNTTVTTPSPNTQHDTVILDDDNQFHYRDLSCNEVMGAWRVILIASISLNVIGFTLGIYYVYFLCSIHLKRNNRRTQIRYA